MTIAEALARARRAISAAEARLLLQHVLDAPVAELAAHPESPLTDCQSRHHLDLVARRAAGEPIAYLIGRREFYGRDFSVTPSVLIPRPETELLVEVGIDKLHTSSRPRVLDLGTGSGCVAITLALESAGEVTAVDISPDALAVARDNAQRLGAVVRFAQSDWFSGIDGRFDLIVANPPYVAAGDPHLEQGDLRFEPPIALACGADGLAAIRHIVDAAKRHLAPGGWLFFEHGYDQAAAVRELLVAAGFGDIEQHRDLAGIVRVSGGREIGGAV
jgi:release factor glutamine methyltransferase